MSPEFEQLKRELKQELKQELTESLTESLTTSLTTSLGKLFDQRYASLVLLIEQLSDSHHKELRELHIASDRQENRLSRHGGLLMGGQKAVTRLSRWAERVDEATRLEDQRVALLEERVTRLEQREQ